MDRIPSIETKLVKISKPFSEISWWNKYIGEFAEVIGYISNTDCFLINIDNVRGGGIPRNCCSYPLELVK